MLKLDVAYINRRGEELVVAVLDEAFGLKSHLHQKAILERIQNASKLAGLSANVAIVWGREDHMQFLAPEKWHPFLRCVDLPWIVRNYSNMLVL